MLKMQPDNHHFRLNITTDKKYIFRPEKNGFVVQNLSSTYFAKQRFIYILL